MEQLPVLNSNTSSNRSQPLIAALYARVSTGRQENEQTIESQIDEVKQRIKADGNILPPPNVFIDDGWTGSILARPALDELRDAVKRQEVQVIYVYDLGRLSRDFTNQLILIKEIEEAGVKLLSLHDINPENEEQGFIRNILGSFHAYERIKIADRFRRGKLYKAKHGMLINGHALYGYRYIKKTDVRAAHYEINEEEADVVRKIFLWVGEERISLREVIKRLYDLSIPPRKRKSDFWAKGPVVRILRCKSYLEGVVHYNKSEAVVGNSIKNEKYRKVKKNSRRMRPETEWLPFKEVPVILEDQALFDKVQKILDYNQKYARKNRKYDYLVSDRIFCSCGNKRVGDGSSLGGHFYYRCAERVYKFPLPHKCKAKGINAVILDTLLWKELLKILTKPSLLKEQAEKWLKVQIDNDFISKEKTRLCEMIQKIEEEEERYAKAYGAGTLDFEQFQGLMKGTKRRKLPLERQLKALDDRISQESLSIGAHELVEEAKKVLQTLDLGNKIQVVRDIIDKVIIKERSLVEVWAHVPLYDLKLGYEPTSRDRRSSECR